MINYKLSQKHKLLGKCEFNHLIKHYPFTRGLPKLPLSEAQVEKRDWTQDLY